ncbi:MAG: cell division protein FtsL [Desulfotomaculaceae bacterium]|nr:cell division protein FtsL [Desulfotomaculaceae bacterium]
MIVAQEKTGFYGLSADRPRQKKNLRLKHSSRGPKIVLIGMVLLGFALGIMIIYFQARVFKLGYQISGLQQELAVLRVENHDLDDRVQQLASLDRVETLAVNKLGMVKPDSSNVLMLAVDNKTQPLPDAGLKDGTAVSPLTGDSGSLLVRAFNELVNRLENKTWPGRNIGAGSKGVTYADNESVNPKKNNWTLSDCRRNLSNFNSTTGLAAAC